MKKLILFELIILFLATTFESDNPPGWFQQTLPVNDQINDIFFLDSLTGWVVTDGRTSTNDTGYIMKTTDGGNIWAVQYNQPMRLSIAQFFDLNTGYVGGGSGSGTGRVFKTTNSGNSWNQVSGSTGLGDLDDMFFINVDTGWVCDKETFGGLIKTTNGCATWQLQLNDTFRPSKLFFISKDTGWVLTSDPMNKVYRTNNGGINWNLSFIFGNNANARDIFFSNKDTGWVTRSQQSTISGISKTTDGGFNWVTQIDPDPFGSGLEGIYFIDNNTGYIATGFDKVIKTTNGGLNWFMQNGPSGSYRRVQFVDTQTGWAGGGILIHTTDGGGPPIGILYTGTVATKYRLDQNFPNPFNPTTIIFFELFEKSTVELKVFNILGEEVAEMVDDDHFTAGVYQFGFDASKEDLPSGVYFYRLIAKSEASDKVFIDTKKMILLK
jgi:photosystem II stability/assembly factor-like uncharacterized protein